MSEIMMNKVVEPFFTTRGRKGGTGLGLYIAMIIVEQKMGGNISVINTSEGAQFTLSLRNS
jgi:C4-dicarboxylate-specific signal transduction histidine kinase